ncbi:unnamed protein product [Ranitomeya imitator]|uniref:Uncharacterized protein n=1 Tax=Ranitomeya imitator TaxID=111125 RepID=A0ABN9LPH5_9NEOB|nr:unnamed protein product [Ranitomeya imitator]
MIRRTLCSICTHQADKYQSLRKCAKSFYQRLAMGAAVPGTKTLFCLQQGPPGSQPSPHAQPPPHNPNMMGPHSQIPQYIYFPPQTPAELCQISIYFAHNFIFPQYFLFQPFMSPRYGGGPRPHIRMGSQWLMPLLVSLWSLRHRKSVGLQPCFLHYCGSNNPLLQPPGGVPGSQPLLPNSMDPTRQGHPGMGGPMQRMNPPRPMGPMGPGPQSDPWLSLQNYGSGMRPPPNSLGPGMSMGPGAGRPWPNPNSANSQIPYSSSSPGTYVGPPGGGGPPGTPIMPSPAESTNSSDNIYTMINTGPPTGNRSNGRSFLPVHWQVVTTDASLIGWGAVFCHLTVQGRWSPQESSLPINVLEIRAIFLSLRHWERTLRGLPVRIQTDNATAVAYVNHQGGTRSSLALAENKVVFRPPPSFLPKVVSTFHLNEDIVLPSFCPAPTHPLERSLNKLDLVRAVMIYLDRTSTFRKTDSFFVIPDGTRRGQPASKATIARWIRMAILEAYRVKNRVPPPGIKAHSTRAVGASWAVHHRASALQLCKAATWSSIHTFAKFYKVHTYASADASLGRRILQAAVFPMGPGSDGPMGGMGGMEPHHMNGSLGSGDMDGLPKNSPNNISGISNPPGTPRDDGELGGNFLHSFQNDNVSRFTLFSLGQIREAKGVVQVRFKTSESSQYDLSGFSDARSRQACDHNHFWFLCTARDPVTLKRGNISNVTALQIFRVLR